MRLSRCSQSQRSTKGKKNFLKLFVSRKHSLKVLQELYTRNSSEDEIPERDGRKDRLSDRFAALKARLLTSSTGAQII